MNTENRFRRREWPFPVSPAAITQMRSNGEIVQFHVGAESGRRRLRNLERNDAIKYEVGDHGDFEYMIVQQSRYGNAYRIERQLRDEVSNLARPYVAQRRELELMLQHIDAYKGRPDYNPFQRMALTYSTRMLGSELLGRRVAA